jgi:hypothetical protein
MNKRFNDIQFIGLLLILVALLGTFTSASRYQKAIAAQQAATAQSKSGKQAEDAEKQVIVQPVSFEAVVNFVHFNLAQEFYVIFGPTFSRLQLFTVHSFQQPLFVISYFENTFCHHIAINAP